MSQEPGLVFDSFAQAERYERTHCYPVQIAHTLGYDPINRGISGGSNDAVFRLFTEETLTPSDIVIACWTGINRSEIYHKDWVQLCPGAVPKEIDADYFKHWLLYSANNEASILNKTKNILALNTLAHAQGIQVLNIDSFWPVSDVAWPHTVSWPTAIDFISWCQQHDFPHTDWGHFFKPAHDSFAEHVLQNIAGRVATTPVS